MESSGQLGHRQMATKRRQISRVHGVALSLTFGLRG